MNSKGKIKGGIYLVVDPSMDTATLLNKIAAALTAPVAAVQIWDNFSPESDMPSLISCITDVCHAKGVPVLINNQWECLLHTRLDGVHFDAIPEDYAAIRQQIQRPFIAGLTCNNDLYWVQWADEHQLDYISFCSIFPSTTSNSCDLVSFDTVTAARKITAMPIFLAGGIKPGNLPQLAQLDYDGIAVVSGIMSVEQPGEAIRAYYQQLKNK